MKTQVEGYHLIELIKWWEARLADTTPSRGFQIWHDPCIWTSSEQTTLYMCWGGGSSYRIKILKLVIVDTTAAPALYIVGQ